MKGMLVIISGPSGSGKGTVVRNLDKNHYSLSISVTTRAKRPTETEGVEYFFRTEEEFVRMREENELLEHAQYVGHNYGTPRRYVEEQIANGKVVVLEIEVRGALQVRDKFPEAVLVFLMPPTLEELTRRLVFRNTEQAMEIEDRLHRALEEVQLIDQYDYLVINDEIPDVLVKLDAIVKAERLKPSRCKEAVKNFIQ